MNVSAMTIAISTTDCADEPPALVVLVMQRWFVKGLVDAEK